MIYDTFNFLFVLFLDSYRTSISSTIMYVRTIYCICCTKKKWLDRTNTPHWCVIFTNEPRLCLIKIINTHALLCIILFFICVSTMSSIYVKTIKFYQGKQKEHVQWHK